MLEAQCYKYSDQNIPVLQHDLIQGRSYQVERIEMFPSFTEVWLTGKDKPYNSIIFQFFEDGKEINIYKDPRFNKYLK